MKIYKLILPALLSFNLNFANAVESSDYPFVSTSNEAHEVTLLNDGSSSFYKRIEMIKQAKKSIVMEYFIFNHDLVGKIMVHELAKKVKEGVKVEILVDNFTVAAELTPHHSSELLKRGIKIKYFNPLPFINAVKTNYRNHRKLFLVDDEKYIVGGRNIGDDYFDLSERYNFIDRDAVFEGPSAKDARVAFDVFFKSKHSETVKRPPMPTLNQLEFLRSSQSQRGRVLQELRAKVRRWREDKSKGKDFFKFSKDEISKVKLLYKIGKGTFANEYSGKCNSIEMVSDRPLLGPSNDDKRITREFIYNYLQNAKSKINIDSPYFILNKELIDIVSNSLSSGVEVSLLTNGIYSSDALPVAAVFNHYLKSWIEKGLNPSVYSGKNLLDESFYVSKKVANTRWGTHSKTLSIDGDLSVIGSYNFDPRSAVYSMELMVACHGNKGLAQAIEDDINFRRESSVIFKNISDVKKHEFDNVNMFKQMGYYLVKPISLLLQWFL